MSDKPPLVCEHDHLARSCDLCFYTKEVARLEAALAQAEADRKVLAEEVRKSRAIMGPFGTLRDGVIYEDSLMYEDARRATDASGALTRGVAT